MKSIINLNIVTDYDGTGETSEELIILEKHTYMHGSGNVASISIQCIREIWA